MCGIFLFCNFSGNVVILGGPLIQNKNLVVGIDRDLSKCVGANRCSGAGDTSMLEFDGICWGCSNLFELGGIRFDLGFCSERGYSFPVAVGLPGAHPTGEIYH